MELQIERMNILALVLLRQLLDYVAEHDSAVSTFNVNNLEQVQSLPDESGYLSLLLDITTACKHISLTVGRGIITGMLGASNSTYLQGEPQNQPDIIANDILVDAFSWTGYLARKL